MTPPVPSSRRNPVLLVMSVLAGAQVLTGGATLAEVIGPQVAGLVVLGVAAVQAGVQFYVRGQVTPWDDVYLKRAPGGDLIAGPAYPASNGTIVEPGTPTREPVDSDHV